MITRRDSKRLAITLKGSYRVEGSSFPFSVMTVINISHTGICFESDQKFEPGKFVDLNITLNGEQLDLFAKVIWSNQIYGTEVYQTGVSILNIGSRSVEKFKNFYQDQLIYPPRV